VIELRSFAKGRKRTDAGYFDGDHRQALAEHAARLNGAGAAVYVTLNPINPQLLSRYANRIEVGATATTTDAQVTRRRWLLLDFDPTRPTDTSATDAQLESAKGAARACFRSLRAEGWPDPLAAESGNGAHLLYPLDLPNDNESRDLVKGALDRAGGAVRHRPRERSTNPFSMRAGSPSCTARWRARATIPRWHRGGCRN
jgi:hypothetical protein